MGGGRRILKWRRRGNGGNKSEARDVLGHFTFLFIILWDVAHTCHICTCCDVHSLSNIRALYIYHVGAPSPRAYLYRHRRYIVKATYYFPKQ